MNDNPLGDLTSAEYAIVGIAMRDPDRMDEIDLSPGDFENLGLGALYGLLSELVSEGLSTEPAVVASRIPTLRVGSGAASAPLRGLHGLNVMDVYNDYQAPALIHTYAQMVRNAAIKRRIVQGVAQIDSLARSDMDVAELVEHARQIMDSTSRDVAHEWSMDTEYTDYVGRIGEPVTMYATSITGLANVFKGYRAGALYTVAARPGMGKSIYAVQAALDLAEHGQVIMHSLEMNQDEIFGRITANVARVNASRLDGSAGEMRAEDWVMVHQHQDYIRNLTLHIDDRRGINMNQIRSRVRTASRRGKVSGLIVDHIGLVEGKPWQKSRNEVIAGITRELKNIAGEFDIPVIALSQMNREVEARATGIPTLGDLRESGSIEQDSDVVIFLFDNDNGFQALVEKNRQGQNHVFVPLLRRGEYSRIDDIQS